MESIRKLDSIIEYEYCIDTYENISTVLFFLPYNPFQYKRNTINIDSFYIASNKAYLKAKEYAAQLCSAGIECVPNPDLDYKAAAERCGLGRGKNTLIYLPQGGSRYAIGALRLKKTLPSKKFADIKMPCKNCNICEKACPSGAISDTFDRNKCIREYMLKPEKADLNMLSAFDFRLLGCDICQKNCPLNKQGYGNAPSDLESIFDIENFYTLLKEKKLDIFSGYFGKNYANRNTLLSMLLIIIGNSGDSKYIKIAEENLNNPSGRVKFAAEYAYKKLC